jgi:hypothetical protein
MGKVEESRVEHVRETNSERGVASLQEFHVSRRRRIADNLRHCHSRHWNRLGVDELQLGDQVQYSKGPGILSDILRWGLCGIPYVSWWNIVDEWFAFSKLRRVEVVDLLGLLRSMTNRNLLRLNLVRHVSLELLLPAKQILIDHVDVLVQLLVLFGGLLNQ